MNRPASLLAPGPLLLATLILVAALSRLLPHPPNFSPLAAIALFGGAYFADKRWSMLVPVAALLLSDIAMAAMLGATYRDYVTSSAYLPSLIANYASLLLVCALGFGLRGKVSSARVLGYSIAGALLFFVISNFAVWLTAMHVPGYPACNAGLMPCYVAALPFLQWSLLGSVFYAAVLFGGFAVLRHRVPALHAQTV